MAANCMWNLGSSITSIRKFEPNVFEYAMILCEIHQKFDVLFVVLNYQKSLHLGRIRLRWGNDPHRAVERVVPTAAKHRCTPQKQTSHPLDGKLTTTILRPIMAISMTHQMFIVQTTNSNETQARSCSSTLCKNRTAASKSKQSRYA